MILSKRTCGVLVVGIASLVFSMAPAQAKKPDNPGGGKPGGGGDGNEPRFSVIEIPIDNGFPFLSDADPNGVITVAIDGSEAGYSSAAFAKVNRDDGAVLSYGFLPEPLFVDPNDGVEKNGGSNPSDVNISGQIVGSAQTYDPDAAGISSPSRAYLWVDEGAEYSLTALSELPGATYSFASGINSLGDIVGGVTTSGGDRAVVWDAETLAVTDLNTLVDAPSLGWELRWANDINDDGMIAGIGRLDGVDRGFVLDRTTQQISAVPLGGPAHSNIATQLSAQGRLVGSMWDGDGSPFGLNPDFYFAYTWDGTGSDPEFLPSVTDNTSIAIGLNDGDATVGYSVIPTDELFADDTVATLWEPDDSGVMQAINLREEIPNKPDYRLDYAFDINNDGWIGVHGRKFHKGKYSWPALLLVPNASSAAAMAIAAVPEPSTLLLVAIGLLGVIGRKRRPLS